MIIIFCKIHGKKIPLVMMGTSTFVGSSQFGKKAKEYRKKFLFHPKAILELLEEAYKVGCRGIHAVDAGKILQAVKMMKESYEDFLLIGSSIPGPDPLIEGLIQAEAEIIFVHGSVSDKKDTHLMNLVDEINSRGVITGLAVHNPIDTLNFAFKNLNKMDTFLVPFNKKGLYMGDKQKLEEIIDNNEDKNFIGMKTLAAGQLEPQEAYQYIQKHNICAATIGMVTGEEARMTSKIALKALKKEL